MCDVEKILPLAILWPPDAWFTYFDCGRGNDRSNSLFLFPAWEKKADWIDGGNATSFSIFV